MAARDQAFAIAEIMQVSRGVALRDFPEFPKSGTLVTLAPACAVGERELNGFSAEVTTRNGKVRLDYSHWQVNTSNVIGLLCRKVDEATLPLGSPVRFVRRGS